VASADFDLLRGTLDLLILKALQGPPQHGFGVSQWIRQVTLNELRLEDGTLYTSLHRLEKRRLLQGEWRVTENNRRARYYRLTPAGKETLSRDSARWTAYATAVFRILKTKREAIRILEEAV